MQMLYLLVLFLVIHETVHWIPYVPPLANLVGVTATPICIAQNVGFWSPH